MFLRAYEVLGMRIAYFEVRSKNITRAFVPDAAISDIERALSSPQVSDSLYLDALALRVQIGSVKFICCWRNVRNSGRALLVLIPCAENRG
jgi:hypothetical protein